MQGLRRREAVGMDELMDMFVKNMKIASGLNSQRIADAWDEVTGAGRYTLDKYVPDGDYVVIKFARWAFEKFKGADDHLGTQMRAVGEVMSIGKTYKEAFQKAIRSLEKGRYGLGFARRGTAGSS